MFGCKAAKNKARNVTLKNGMLSVHLQKPHPPYPITEELLSFFVPMRFSGEKAAWVYQAHDTVQLNLFYIMIGLTNHEKQTSCT